MTLILGKIMTNKPLLGPCDSYQIERWKDIPSYPGYQASDLGRVRSLDKRVGCRSGGIRLRKGKVLVPVIHHSGYAVYSVYAAGKMKSVPGHLLVMQAFIGKAPDGFVVCHYDGNRQNNLLINIRYDTKSANEQDKLMHGTYQHADRNPRAKLTAHEVMAMRLRRAAGESVTNLAREYGFRAGHISKICTGALWKTTSGPLTREAAKHA
jgi:hypothetical protein